MPNTLLENAALMEYKRRIAAYNLANFITYTKQDYKLGWVHEEICTRLDQFLEDVAAKKSPRLIICMPPRSGKSEIVSRKFPAYALGRYPELQIVSASYSGDLSATFCNDVESIIDSEEYQDIFQGIRIPQKHEPTNGEKRQADRFDLMGHKNSYYSVGVGGSLTGRGADILIIDDPIKDMADAMSEKIRNSTWDWYTSTAYTRLSDGGGCIVMCTRWHMDDPIGRLINAMDKGEGDKWTVINYPAIAEKDETHRKTGEALHPERFSLERLLSIKNAVGSRVWQALYQQSPVPDGGAVFRQEWFKFYRRAQLPPHFEITVQSWDMTFKAADNSDFVCGLVIARKGADYYVIARKYGRFNYVESKKQIIDLTFEYPKTFKKLVEDKANGSAIIDDLGRDISGIIPIKPTESKEARAQAVTALFEAGNVYFPDPNEVPWVNEFITELLQFPTGAHDDQVDALTQGLNYLLHKRTYNFSERDKILLRQGIR